MTNLQDNIVCEVEDQCKNQGVDNSNNRLTSSWGETQEDTGCEDEEEEGSVKNDNIVHFVYIYSFYFLRFCKSNPDSPHHIAFQKWFTFVGIVHGRMKHRI